MEEQIFFPSGDLPIEGLLELNDPCKAVVITHPHPLYGGDMDNPVVEAIGKAYRAKEYSTLRFNFRGVGRSGGRYADGIGEAEDVRGAFSYLQEKGIEQIDLAGYSFGTRVNVEALRQGARPERMVMVSPPVKFMEFGDPLPLPCLKLVTTGSNDDIAPPALLAKVLPRWSQEAKLEIIEGADHFYMGYVRKLETVLLGYL